MTPKLDVLVRVKVDCIKHHTGIISQNDEGPDLPHWTPSLQTPTPLQLQVVIRKFFNQEVGCTCRETLLKLWAAKVCGSDQYL